MITTESNAYAYLDSLLEHPDRFVQKEALYALTRIHETSEAQKQATTLSSSNQIPVETFVINILNEACVESCQSRLASVLKHADLSFLLSVLNSENAILVRVATVEIEYISQFEAGARAVGTSNLLCRVIELLENQDPSILKAACRILTEVAHFCRNEVMELNPYGQLISLFRSLAAYP
ncbi:hypothetical protein C8R44DRAFT_876907 [Mycena epipterygia]|nr:hypothetical protein C8R44DRAFT_876907 [Mycena epipterygia]